MRPLPPSREAVRPVVQMLAIPQGFTLTIAGTLALTIGKHGYQGAWPIWLFVVGGSLGFCLMSFYARAEIAVSTAAGPVSGLAIYNAVPIAVVPLGYLLTHWISSAGWAYFLSSLIAVELYIGLFSSLSALTRAYDLRRRG